MRTINLMARTSANKIAIVWTQPVLCIMIVIQTRVIVLRPATIPAIVLKLKTNTIAKTPDENTAIPATTATATATAAAEAEAMVPAEVEAPFVKPAAVPRTASREVEVEPEAEVAGDLEAHEGRTSATEIAIDGIVVTTGEIATMTETTTEITTETDATASVIENESVAALAPRRARRCWCAVWHQKSLMPTSTLLCNTGNVLLPLSLTL